MDAVTRAHGQYEQRNLVWQRLLAVLIYVGALCTGIVALPIAAVGPGVLQTVLPRAVQPMAGELVAVLYFPVLGTTLIIALASLYKIALPYKPPWWRGLPGAAFAAVVFLVGATGLRMYLTWLTGTGYTYGALAAPIAFLLATFFVAFAIIVGAHLNAALLLEWPAALRRRGRVVEYPVSAMIPRQRLPMEDDDTATPSSADDDTTTPSSARHG